MADGMFAPASPGTVEFVKLIPDGLDPKRADRTAAGHLPGRAMRYCDAITSAAGYGYWLFPPIDLQLLWDGEEIVWSYGDEADWLPLSDTASGAVQFPGFEAAFDAAAPEVLHGYSPPFLTALAEPGTFQIWTGLAARTRPGWSLLVREPANLSSIPGLVGWEGMVETDQWFGPLFSVFRITRTDHPVRLRSNVPFLQVQPVPQAAYSDETLNQVSVRSIADMSQEDWRSLANVVAPTDGSKDKFGSYAVSVRKRRGCPYHAEVVRNAVDAG